MKTVKQLYGAANSCAYPGCEEPLLREVNGVLVLNSRMAHIRAASAGGPRHDPHMSEEERRGFDNLLLLCFSHAEEIDLPELLADHTVERLKGWKELQRMGSSGTSLPGHLLDRAVAMEGFSVDFGQSVVSMGGEGGRAPGAGGGGGGALGPGAKGGDGGPGGDSASVTVTGTEAMGKVPIVVGKGGRPGVVGMPGECGGHSQFGSVLVHGGGREAHDVGPDDLQGVTETVISAALMANYIEFRDGLVFLAGAGWTRYLVNELPAPFSAGLCVWVDVTLDGWDCGEAVSIEVIAELFTPTDHVTLSQKAVNSIAFDRTQGWTRAPVALNLRGTLHDAGTHILHLSCNGSAHADFRLEVEVAKQT